MNRPTAALILFVLASSLAARADDASHRAKAQEMMSILQSQQMVKNVADGLKNQFTEAGKNVIGVNPTAEKQAHAAEFVKRAGQMIDTQMSWSVLQPAFTDIYVKNFTEEQLNGIIAFYKSPAGLALLTTMPTVNNQISQFGNQKINDLKPQLKQLYDDFKKTDGSPAIAPLGMDTLPHSAPSTPAAGPAGTPK